MQSGQIPEKKFVLQKILFNSRQMLVIQGIPFYFSTGFNSKHPDTCLPHCGIDESEWIRKPKNIYMPSDVRLFCEKNDIARVISVNRLGSIQTACISASIGGGFWKTAEGEQLKNYLFTSYPQYFLDQNTVDLIKSAPDETKKSSVNEANKRIFEMGAIIPDHPASRLPYEEELKFFEGLSNKDKLCQALMSMLTSEATITKGTYHNIVKIVKDETLINYIIDQHLLEDSAQRKAFNQLMEEVEPITLKDLEGINLFGKVELSSTQRDIIRISSVYRIQVRSIINKGKANKPLFDFYERLYDINCLYKSFALHKKNREILYSFNKYGLLDSLSFKLIAKLRHALLDDCHLLTATKEGCFAVASLCKIADLHSQQLRNSIILYTKLNNKGLLSEEVIIFLQVKGNFEFLDYLINKNQLDKNILDIFIKSFIADKMLFTALFKLNKYDKLNEDNVELIQSLRIHPRFDDCVNLLDNPDAVDSLKILRECKSLNEDHLSLLFSLKNKFLLKLSRDLLENKVTRDILVRYRNKVNSSFIHLIHILNESELLDKCIDLFNNDLALEVLDRLFFNRSLTPQNITVIDQLCKTGSLSEKIKNIEKILLKAKSFPVSLETLIQDDVYKKISYFWNQKKKPDDSKSEVMPSKPSIIKLLLLKRIPKITT